MGYANELGVCGKCKHLTCNRNLRDSEEWGRLCRKCWRRYTEVELANAFDRNDPTPPVLDKATHGYTGAADGIVPTYY